MNRNIDKGLASFKKLDEELKKKTNNKHSYEMTANEMLRLYNRAKGDIWSIVIDAFRFGFSAGYKANKYMSKTKDNA